jgi:hypothetical protein
LLLTSFLPAWMWLLMPWHEAGANDKITLHLVYTSDTNGYVDPCG